MAPAQATSTSDFPLAGETATDQGTGLTGEDAGAAGQERGGVGISHGALIAIIIVVVCVAVLGIGTSILYYLAKKREWQVRDKLRRSARRVVIALTPRSRTEFPRSVKDGSHSSNSMGYFTGGTTGGGQHSTWVSSKGRNGRSGGGRMMRLNEDSDDVVPPTPKLRQHDIEKALAMEQLQRQRTREGERKKNGGME